ncbi:MAG TPA: OsmC family protein, partial [Agriterribacter sp.]|nr:OsmC family protein [Agriterribacter sp.]
EAGEVDYKKCITKSETSTGAYMTVQVNWKKEHEFDSLFGDTITAIDGDRVSGPGPKSLLLTGLAGCTGIDVVDILTKMRVVYADLSIEAEAEQTEEHPKVFKDIQLTYRIRTEPENEEKVKKAIELSLEKYCGVAAMLRKNSDIHYQLELLK